MSKRSLGAAFVKRISAEALGSAAIHHPYLCALRDGEVPNIDMALKDFAFQYSLYSARFTHYVAAVIQNLSSDQHKQILLANLAEEQGATNDIALPTDVLKSIEGQPHSELFRRFQEALGIDTDYRETADQCQTALLWSRQFLQLCQMNEYVGIGAVGIGTELIVPGVYSQILESIKVHSNLTMADHVFFNLHSQCDDEHAAQIALVAEDLATTHAAREQIEYGVKLAITMRVVFWDKMLARAQSFPACSAIETEQVSAVGY